MSLSFQWFPGHMAKTKRKLRRYIEFAQIILYTVDARAPSSTFSKDLLFSKKKLALILTKSDLADPEKTEKWARWFRQQGFSVFKSGPQVSVDALKAACVSSGAGGAIHAMVVGLPNVGKSTLINQLIHKKKAKTGARPGITRGPQWLKLRERFFLLDTPGIFFPQSLSIEKAWRLAAVGTIPDKNYSSQLLDVCERLMRYVQDHYGMFEDELSDFFAFLKKAGKKRGILSKGGEINLDETARRLIVDFQKGNWGRISLEEPA